MTTLHEAAAQGSLADLVSLIEFFKSTDPKFTIDQLDGRGRTALSHAASKGHVHVVKFLLDQGANVNAKDNKDRTVLWHASESHSSVSRQQRFVTVETLLENKADPNILASDGSSALSKFVEHREPTVIKLLQDYHATTEHKVKKGSKLISIEELARATKDSEVIDAIVRGPDQAARKDEVVGEIVNYFLRSIGYMNTTLGDVVRKWFGIGGNLQAPLKCVPVERDLSDSDSDRDIPHEENRVEPPPSRIYGNSGMNGTLGLTDAADFSTLAIGNDQDDDVVDDVPLVSEISAKTTPQQFQASMMKFINETGLGYFFEEGNKFLEDVANKAAELEGREGEVLNTKEAIQDITKLALYQPVFYCGNTSMKSGTRARDQIRLVRRVARISTLLVPDDCGTELQFINRKRTPDKTLKAEQVEEIMQSVEPRGNTKIGTNLERRILNPLLYDVVHSGGKVERPILVSCITDGCASGEPSSEFKNTIVRCLKFLKEHEYPLTTVRFQISQIGNDSGAESFLDQLRNDPVLKDVLFCTTQRLDEEYKKLKENDEDLERWLLQTLMGPILSLGSK
ncbi:hypothetical protein BBK36DRAFT_1111674 [Trichoderma citrinoviride]|uniref:Uncharacterized protein n=1 Tax=Trichoderma citrinoviride TaxID=58853 RepID=A0A2T4BJQ5_9HYPO|nr:hypothetical protein BBK36DRAFT_1111674 [Trichoderma citrinoviride]PTB69528.1 hypothetical protein BBK36DRAFT_1111674 [Trichoderma citrinoviride]